MHFSIPETCERRDARGSTYTSYEVHINGVRHCSVRYRQLHALNERLRREFRPQTLPTFPPKRMLPLTPIQVEERRLTLEKYLQLLSQDARVSNGVAFNGFLLAAQQETAAEKTEEADLDVYLMNDSKMTIRGLTVLQTEEILERVCRQLGVPDELVYYFALFLIRGEESGEVAIMRKLQDFESPYISQKSLAADGTTLKLVLRKCSWDTKVDDELLANKVTLNLLYIQTLADVERGWAQASQDVRGQLAQMQARGAKKDYMEMARQLKDYGYIHFKPAICDYPMTNTTVNVLVGGRELILRIPCGPNGEASKEGRFRVTKMRCWRIMSLTSDVDDDEVQDATCCKLELSFEYLMASGELQWVTIVSSQAILMSLCLQSIVEELLRMRSGVAVKKAGEKSCTSHYTYKRKDGSELVIPIRSGLHAPSGAVSNTSNKNGSRQSQSSILGPQYSVKKLSERFDVVNMRDASRAAEDVFIENEAFMELKDEDL